MTSGKACVRDKIPWKDTHGGSDELHEPTQVARTFDKWDSLAIAARGITILKKCEERWDFTMVDEPHSYMSYLPLLFGASHQAIADGKTGKKITERSLAKVVDKLLADFGK